MKCRLCEREKPHKHGKTSKGTRALLLPKMSPKFYRNFRFALQTIAAVSEEEIGLCCFFHAEGRVLQGISRISGLAYDTIASIIRAASEKAQMVHNASVQSVESS